MTIARAAEAVNREILYFPVEVDTLTLYDLIVMDSMAMQELATCILRANFVMPAFKK